MLLSFSTSPNSHATSLHSIAVPLSTTLVPSLLARQTEQLHLGCCRDRTLSCPLARPVAWLLHSYRAVN